MDRRVKAVLEHLLGPTGSVIIHVVIILMLVKFVVFETQTRAPDVEVVIMEPDAVDLEEFEQELKELEDMPQIVDAVDIPDVALDQEQPPDPTDFDSAEPDVDFAALDVSSDVRSPLVMKGLLKGRSGAGRAQMLADYAGKWGQFTENAVIKALEWLKKNQNEDGSWGPNKTAMTGLALLTYLAHGETTASEEYGEAVEKSIRFLISRQDADGKFTKTDNQPGPYSHAVATYAISEAYGLTRIPSIKPVMEKAIKVIIDGQQPKGGWNYKYDKGARRDTSVAGWQVQALKAAYIAGADVPGLKNAMERAAEDLQAHQDAESSRFFYTDNSSHKTDCITSIGVLCLQLLGHARDKEVRDALDAMKGADCDWSKPPPWPLYAWYYVTQAKFHQGGQTWAGWNAKFARQYVKNQNEDGSWTSPGANSKLEHGKEVNHGPVYATTLAALTLQVYYRFLPTYKPIAVEPVDETSDDDVVIEII